MATWHKGKPTESGYYVTIMEYGSVMTIPYSAKYDVWNAYDEQTKESAKEYEIKADLIKQFCELQEFLNYEVERQE